MPAAPLVLASASPRRREILSAMGVEVEVIPSKVDESAIFADHPRTFAIRAAFAKARDVAANCEEGRWVLGADTVVTKDMILYGKPRDARDARRILEKLSGEAHEVITGIALVQSGSATQYLHAESTRVHFRQLTPGDIDAYIATGEPMDKAGAYGIQGHGAALVDRIEGDYYNVVGLPNGALIALVAESTAEFPVKPLPVPDRWRR